MSKILLSNHAEKLPPTNNLGWFEVSIELVRDHWDDLLSIMGNFVVVNAEHNYANNTIRYLAYSTLFVEIPKDYAFPTPWYEIRVTKDAVAGLSIEAIPLSEIERRQKDTSPAVKKPLTRIIDRS